MQTSATKNKNNNKKNSSNLLSLYIKSRGGLFAQGSFDVLLFVFWAIILFTGLVMLYSSSYPKAYTEGFEPTYYFKNQVIGAALGIVLMIIIGKMNHMLFMEAGAILGTLVSVVFLVLALFIGSSDDGSDIRRWVTIAGIRFQPSDIAKFTLILTLAYLFHRWHHLMVSKKPLRSKRFQIINRVTDGINHIAGKPVLNESFIIVMGSILVIGLYVGLVFAGSHLSGAVIMLAVAAVMLYLGEIRPTWILFFIIVVILALPILLSTDVLSNYMVDRITNFLSPEKDMQGADWQTIQALYAIGSGGFFGRGLGQSVQKYNYVPEPQNDMIFSIVIEELGFIGGAAIIILFALIVWRGIVIGVNCPTRYGALTAFGITFKLALQVILNIGVATNIIPNTGITLPFFSYGRTALIVNLIEMGILFSISRSSRMKKV